MRIFVGFYLILFLFLNNLSAENKTMQSLLNNVLISDVKVAKQGANSLLKELEKKNANIEVIRSKFANLVYAWRSVDSVYIAGDMDENLLDLPRYVDIFHEGNEDIKVHMARVMTSSDEPSVALFKNSYKTINALEYILYSTKILSQRQLDLSIYIVKSIEGNLDEVLKVYEKENKKLLTDEKWANSAILNALITSSYKLAMWRIGEVLGNTKKYNKPDAKRLEYHLSHLSLKSIEAVIDTHIKVMDGKFENFGDMAIKNGAKDEVENIRKMLNESKTLVSTMKEEDLTSKKGEELYQVLKKIYLGYALYMVDALSITAKIVEADGD